MGAESGRENLVRALLGAVGVLDLAPALLAIRPGRMLQSYGVALGALAAAVVADRAGADR